MWEDVRWVEGIIFDCDGVLIDSEEANVRFYSLILERLGLSAELSDEDKMYVHMHTVHESLAKIVPQSRLEEALQVARGISYRQVLDWVQPQPGLMEFLHLLRWGQIPCAVSTNRTATLPLVLEHFDLSPFFQPVISASDVTFPKPHPESVHTILHKWKLRPERIVFIGDSAVDQYTAEASGVTFWAFGNPGLEADRHIANYWSLQQNFRAAQPRCRNAPLC